MPKQVEKQISARAVRKGMEFKWRRQWWSVDEAPITKMTYTYIDIGEDEPVRIPSGAMVTIRVIEPTAQERYDKYLGVLEDLLVDGLTQAVDKMQEARENLRKAVEPGPWDVDRWAGALGTYRIWSFLARVVHMSDPDAGGTIAEAIDRADPGDLISCLEDALKELRREVWRKQGRSGTPIHEGFAQAEIDTKREFVDRWDGMLATLKHYADELQKEQADD